MKRGNLSGRLVLAAVALAGCDMLESSAPKSQAKANNADAPVAHVTAQEETKPESVQTKAEPVNPAETTETAKAADVSAATEESAAPASETPKPAVTAKSSEDAAENEVAKSDKQSKQTPPMASPERRYAEGMFVSDAELPGGLIEIDRAVLAKTRYGQVDKSYEKSTPLLDGDMVKTLKNFPIIGVIAYGGTKQDAPVVALRVTYLYDRYKALPLPELALALDETDSEVAGVHATREPSPQSAQSASVPSVEPATPAESEGKTGKADGGSLQTGETASAETGAEKEASAEEDADQKAVAAATDAASPAVPALESKPSKNKKAKTPGVPAPWVRGQDGITMLVASSEMLKELGESGGRLRAFSSNVDIKEPQMIYLAGFGVLVEIRADASLGQEVIQTAIGKIRARLAAELRREKEDLERHHQLHASYRDRTTLKEFGDPDAKPVWTALEMVFSAFYEKKF